MTSNSAEKMDMETPMKYEYFNISLLKILKNNII